VHLPEVCRELGLLVAAAHYVLVRYHHFAPRFEVARRYAFDGGASGFSLFVVRRQS
jgi:hypothetical protein